MIALHVAFGLSLVLVGLLLSLAVIRLARAYRDYEDRRQSSTFVAQVMEVEAREAMRRG